MKCPQCDCDCAPDFDFCPKCAAPLRVACPECGFRAPGDFAFCPMCATELVAAVEEPGLHALGEAVQRLVPKEFAERLLATGGQVQAERRMVTILFCDVKGSTSMAEALDPEDVMEIMDGAFDVFIESICVYEGAVARLMGDAVLAFFGAPIAHEDDPERACRAALEIVDRAQAYAEKLELERGISGFDVRVGINTGLVVVGEVGSEQRMEYTAMGDAVNLAARMEGAAEPGTILITEDTHRLIAQLFETEALGPIEVKGRAKPVFAYRVLAAKEVPGKMRGIASLASPLVGREAELQALQRAVGKLEAGVGGVVTIVGEAGIGKSRLVAEVLRQVLDKVPKPSQGLASPQWVEGRCLSYGSSIAYLPWIDVLHGLLGVGSEASPALVRDVMQERVKALCPESFDRVYPYLARLLTLPPRTEDEALLRGLEPERLRANTFRAVATMVTCVADEHPLVVVLDDLHWADPTSIELLEQLLALTDRAPVLFVSVFRPQTDHGSWRLRETAARAFRHRHTDLWLDSISTRESEVLVGNLLHVEGLPEKLTRRIVDQAEGNPFYLEEIISTLIDEGAIAEDGEAGRWQVVGEVSEIPIPATLQGVLTARIDRLPEETKRVLQTASVIGRTFPYRVLAAIAEEECELGKRLLTLQREEMIRERARLPELEYIFKHELTRQAAYRGLLNRERRALHRQVAETIEQLLPGRVNEQPGLLAHHFDRAGDNDRALHYFTLAAENAARSYANYEAISHYTRAIEIAERLTSSAVSLARAHRGRGQVHETLGEFHRARADHEIALHLATAAGEHREQWKALIDLGRLWASRDYDCARAHLERALELAQRIGDPRILAGSLNWMGNWHLNADDPRAALAHHERALEIIQQLGDRRGLATTLDLLGMASLLRGDVAGSGSYYDRAIPIFRELDDRPNLASSLTGRGMAGGHACISLAVVPPLAPGGARRNLEEALRITQEISSPAGEAWVLWSLGLLNTVQGRYGRALEVTQRGIDMALQIGHREWIAGSRCVLGILYLELLVPEKALRQLKAALKPVEELRSRVVSRYVTGALAACHCMLHDSPQAEACLGTVLHPETPMDSMYKRYCWTRRSELALLQGDPTLALDIAERLIASAPGMSPGRVITFLWKLKGEALAAMGHMEEARTLLRAAIDNSQATGERFLQWRLHGSLGRLYRASGRQSEAEKELATARELIQELAETVPHGELRNGFLRRARERLGSSR